MTQFNSLEVVVPFNHAIERLPEVEHRMPILGNFVPIRVNQDTFQFVPTNVQALGCGAMSLSTGRPFGFMRMPEDSDRAYLSQYVDQIELSEGNAATDERSWIASFETERSLTSQDQELFRMGVKAFSFFAGKKLSKLDDSRSK